MNSASFQLYWILKKKNVLSLSLTLFPNPLLNTDSTFLSSASFWSYITVYLKMVYLSFSAISYVRVESSSKISLQFSPTIAECWAHSRSSVNIHRRNASCYFSRDVIVLWSGWVLTAINHVNQVLIINWYDIPRTKHSGLWRFLYIYFSYLVSWAIFLFLFKNISLHLGLHNDTLFKKKVKDELLSHHKKQWRLPLGISYYGEWNVNLL